MKMTKLLGWLAVGAVFVLSANAQVRHFHPEKFERATTTDDQGLIQWADHVEVKCPTCRGTGKMECKTCERYPDEATKCPDCARKENREAVCHACAGEGKFLDPLDRVLCPGCFGGGYVVCAFCPGSGILKLGKDAKRWSNCVACRGDGWFGCPVCDGKRAVDVVVFKSPLREAEADDLKKALEITNGMLTELEALTPTPKQARKDVKQLEKAIKEGEKLYPVLKQMPKLVKGLMKYAYAGSGYEGQEEREGQAITRMRDSVVHFLKHQRHIQELALQRAEANAKVAAGK